MGLRCVLGLRPANRCNWRHPCRYCLAPFHRKGECRGVLKGALPQIKCYRHSLSSSLVTDPATRFGAGPVGKTRRNASANPIWASILRRPPLIDTGCGSPKDHYVKSFVEYAGAASLRPDLPAPSCECYRRRRSACRPPNGTRHHDFRQQPADGCHGWYRAAASQPLTTRGLLHLSEHCPAAARNASCFKASALDVTR